MKKMFFNIFSESFLKEKSESRSMPNGSGRCKTKKERKKESHWYSNSIMSCLHVEVAAAAEV
jgi:hypothetical protein